jgi:glyoxylase-like metal-dependent hydrolase (beta-lactamase superfamily II)
MSTFTSNLRSRIVPIRGIMGYCHLLFEEDGKSCILLDTGLWGEIPLIKSALRRRGLSVQNIKAILMTHGHLDHSGNLAEIRKMTSAPIYAHPAEQDIINGVFPYKGVNAWCGSLENLGRRILRVGRPVEIDVEIEDGQTLPFFDGLTVVHLPGHTLGHCGFFSKIHSTLFCGDLFASYPLFSHQPPPILNTAPEMIASSLRRASLLEADFVIPQHYDLLLPTLHRRRLKKICDALQPPQA